MLDWALIVQNGAEALTAQIVKSATDAASKRLQERNPYAKLDFNPHIEYAYQRCTQIKTILSRDTPIPLLEQYVTLKYMKGAETVDDYELIDNVWKLKRILVTSTGGGGKSMFMRYLWISCTVNLRGKIPIYVELRNINNIEYDDVATFLFHTAVSSKDPSARDLFDAALHDGQFILILDGVDEIQNDKRDKIEAGLLDLANKHLKSIFVVSGRPEDRYNGWQSFCRYTVQPLDKEQTTTLIERTNFDPVSKSKFLDRLKKGEFNKHESFLCRPLLATMMLLMFDYYAEIPNKIHLFYEQAFEALFYIHYTTKEKFTRKRYTNYSIDVFKRYFGNFCLITYNSQVTSFSKPSLRDYIRQAGDIDNVSIDVENFIRDLHESVCVLQDDGVNQTFTHRSFQEYFCAYSLSKMNAARVGVLLQKFAEKRSQDTVLAMLHDINKPLVEDSFIHPMLKQIEKAIPRITSINNLSTFLKALRGSAYMIMVVPGNYTPKQTARHQRQGSNVLRYIQLFRTGFDTPFEFVKVVPMLLSLAGIEFSLHVDAKSVESMHLFFDRRFFDEMTTLIQNRVKQEHFYKKHCGYVCVVVLSSGSQLDFIPTRDEELEKFESALFSYGDGAEFKLNDCGEWRLSITDELKYEIINLFENCRYFTNMKDDVLNLRRASKRIASAIEKREKTLNEILGS